MQFSVRVSDYQKNQMLNICDPNLVGKKLNQKKSTTSHKQKLLWRKISRKKRSGNPSEKLVNYKHGW